MSLPSRTSTRVPGPASVTPAEMNSVPSTAMVLDEMEPGKASASCGVRPASSQAIARPATAPCTAAFFQAPTMRRWPLTSSRAWATSPAA